MICVKQFSQTGFLINMSTKVGLRFSLIVLAVAQSSIDLENSQKRIYLKA